MSVERFLDTQWKVMTGSPNKPEGVVEFLIAMYSIDNAGARKFHQHLRYMPDTSTLENLAGERERCIAFWDRQGRNSAERNSIFAKRIARQDAAFADQRLLPWEEEACKSDGDDGVWGAEGG